MNTVGLRCLFTALMLLPSFALASPIDPTVLFQEAEAWVEPLNYSVPEVSKTEGSVRYLLVDRQINILAKDKKRYYRYASQPTSEVGLTRVSQVEASFFPEYQTLIIHEIQAIRNGIRINKLDKTKLKVFQQEGELEDNLYSESWTALFVLEDIRVGDVIEYSYSVVGSNPVFEKTGFGRSALSWSEPVGVVSFRLMSDASVPVSIKTHNLQAQGIRSNHNGIAEYVLTLHDVAAIREEDSAPNWYTPYAYLSYTQYGDWKEVNNWAVNLYNTDLTLSADILDVVEQHKMPDKLSSAVGMIQWVQDNVRYFGIETGVNSHRPSKPNETFNRRYGDCKDKAVLLVAILNHFDIDAYPALVTTTLSKSLENDLPSPGAFNHVIVTFEVDGKTRWVDATVSNQRGTLDEITFPNFHWALVIKDGNHELTQIEPVSTSQLRSRVSVKQKIELDSNSDNSRLTVDTHYFGWKAEQMRNYIDGTGIQASSKDHLDYFSQHYSNITSDAPITVSDTAQGNSILISERYSLGELISDTQNGNRLSIPATQIQDNIWLPNARQRTTPFVLPYYLDIDIAIEITANDPKYIIWYDEAGAEVTANKWFEYRREVEKSEDHITISYHYSSLMPDIPAHEFNQYATLLESIEPSLAHTLLLRNDTSSIDNTARAKSLVKRLMNKNKGN